MAGLFRSVRSHQVLSEPWRRSINPRGRATTYKMLSIIWVPRAVFRYIDTSLVVQ